MNKKLIALAVAGACVAPTVMAQTANPVTLYGRAYVTLENVKASGVSERWRVEDNSSLFGIRGTEDLGGGLKAFFQFETQFRLDSQTAAQGGASTFAARNSGVGLQGGWGSFLMGRWDSPYKVAGYPADPYILLSLAGYWSTVQDDGNFGRRLPNVVQYWTPNIAGFTARLAVTANEQKTATADPKTFSALIGWARGPVVVNLAYEKHEDQVGSTATAGAEEEGLMGVVSFKFGSTKIAGVAERIEKTGRANQDNLYVSLVQSFGRHDIVGTAGQKKGGQANGAAGPEPKADAMSIGYRYNFTKRTQVHLLYAKIKNNSTSAQNFPLLQVPGVVNGSDPEGVSFGILHVF